MVKTTLTAKQIWDLGLWEKVCEYKEWWDLNFDNIDDDYLIEFDSEFKKEEEIQKDVKGIELINIFNELLEDWENTTVNWLGETATSDSPYIRLRNDKKMYKKKFDMELSKLLNDVE